MNCYNSHPACRLCWRVQRTSCSTVALQTRRRCAAFRAGATYGGWTPSQTEHSVVIFTDMVRVTQRARYGITSSKVASFSRRSRSSASASTLLMLTRCCSHSSCSSSTCETQQHYYLNTDAFPSLKPCVAASRSAAALPTRAPPRTPSARTRPVPRRPCTAAA